MKTIETLWEDYRSAIYPNGMAAIQEHQVKQAFYSGAVVLLVYTIEMMKEIDDDSGQAKLDEILREGSDYMLGKVEEINRARN